MKFEVYVPTWEVYEVEAPMDALHEEIGERAGANGGQPIRREHIESMGVEIFDIEEKPE